MARTQVSRTPLSKQAGVLRGSLLLSLGLSPLACGGSALSSPSGDAGSSSQAGANVAGAAMHGGASGSGGASNQGGASNGGGWPNLGGATNGGVPGTGGTGTGGLSAGGASPVGCVAPVVDPVTKLVKCSNGLVHRPEAVTCVFKTPPAAGGAAGVGTGGGAGVVTCTTHADCSAFHYGYCDGDGGFSLATCHSGCTSDSECGSGICVCDGVTPGRCTYAGCKTDADCGAGLLCAQVNTACGPGGYQCTSAKDECVSNADCQGNSCVFQDGHRECSSVVCGRPFLIAEVPRLAELETRADWLEPGLKPNLQELSPIQRAQLAAHWARLGQMEHASIAAFARFNLQLLSLGAPSDLLEACNRALADETAHARSCFALASAYGGTAIGPSRLDIDQCFEDVSLTAVAKLVLREGCVGETVASLEAMAAAEVATDPAVKRALTRIARDELSHAELAFKFLRWALQNGSAEARHELACAAAQQLADFESQARSGERTRSQDRLAAHGLLGGEALCAIHLAAIRDVARPLLAALFDIEVAGAV